MAEQELYSQTRDLRDIIDEFDGEATIAFSHTGKVWKTRYSFVPTTYLTVDNRLLSTPLLLGYNDSQAGIAAAPPILWEHNTGSRLQFYGDSYPMSITISANRSPSLIKTFNSLSLETNNESFTASVYTNYGPEADGGLDDLQQGAISSFDKREGNYYAAMPRSARGNTTNLIFAGRVRMPLFNPAASEETELFQGQVNIDGTDYNLFAAEIVVPPTTAVPLGEIVNVVMEIPYLDQLGNRRSRLIEFLDSRTNFDIPYSDYNNTYEQKYLPTYGDLRVMLYGQTVLSNGNLAYLITSEVESTSSLSNNRFTSQLGAFVGNTPEATPNISQEIIDEFGIDENFSGLVENGPFLDIFTSVDISPEDAIFISNINDLAEPFPEGFVFEDAIIEFNIYAETPSHLDGDSMRGHYALIHLENTDTESVELFSVNTDFSQSKLDGSGQ